jgi:hypothetical protein
MKKGLALLFITFLITACTSVLIIGGESEVTVNKSLDREVEYDTEIGLD